ncbi:hypothetical protein O7626_31845 [Micromonospora sp. WMMD1102]|uniref:hypothetical protein n=1 Tax=Micromonospora sp. WMMD1102 TaxID=3016105 RepID=UPI002415707B|nr:hypothetical protein [Micromonospora sp. WMMD1102]MDG4790456.1 hypothetical protein [Micromonospora sp. WMMD1102]
MPPTLRRIRRPANLVATSRPPGQRPVGRLLDTLVTAQLRAERAIRVVGADMFHLSDANGRREVALLIERGTAG